MYSINITEPAEQDLNATVDYYITVLKAQKAANTLLDEIEEKLSFLSMNPLVYEIENDDYLHEQNIRSVLVKNHLIFYIVNQDDQQVTVLRILYSRRNWLRILRSNN
jgi:plasmid stabilization system protein ParE